MKKIGFLLAAVLTLAVATSTLAQRGRIIRSASTTVMDPNQDGYISTTTSGFSNDGYNVDEFEIKMFGIPQLGGDVTGDNIGNDCGITDLIPDNKGYSSYAVRDGNNNLIFRFRVGDDNPSVESWTILLDTDGLFGDDDPNATPDNPGFEIDITLIKRNNAGVYVYNIDGIDNCPNELLFYSIDTHFQISIADEVTCGDPDFFYDYFVPFADIANALGINVNTGVRYVAVTNTSATCAMAGKIADVSGIDNTDPEYAGCVACAFIDLVDNQCPTAVIDLCETCPGFSQDLVNAPTIDEPIRAGQTTISGGCDAGIFIVVKVFQRVGGTDVAPIWSTTPRETKANYAIGTIWSVDLAGPLVAYDKIVARAQADEFSVPCGGDDDESSSTSITVVAPNTKPVANNQLVNAPEDTATPISLTGSDPENDVITYVVVTGPSHGILSGTAPNLTYTPNLNYNGPDNFTFKTNDGIYDSDPVGTVTINVLPVNDAPLANNQNVTVTEDLAQSITLTGSDVDGNPLTYAVVSPPVHGVLSGVAPNLTYTPALNYNGSDSFTFMVNDGTVDSNIGTVSITVTPVQDAPAANNQSINVPEDVTTSITLTGSDPDENALTYTVVSGPSNGTLNGTVPNLTYTPNLNYNGPDNFTFKVNDGSTDSNIATVTITVTPVNDAPIANSQNVTYDLNVPKAITLTGSDVDGNPLTYSVVTPPSNGILSGTAPNLTYTPNLNFTGADSFTFKVNDGSTDSNIATISLNLTTVTNTAPIANDQVTSLPEDTPTSIILSATDIDGNVLAYTIVTPPVHGVLSGAGANRTYSPSLNYSGPDFFTFKVNDGTVDSNIGTVSITVTSVNDAPIANNQAVTTQEEVAKAITLTGSDVEGSLLTFTIVNPPTHGSLTGTGANVTYTPNLNFNGADSFTFNVHDGTTSSNNGIVSITVTPENDAPSANNQSVTTPEDVAKGIILSGNDIDGDALTFSVVSNPANGVLTGTAPNLTYNPNSNFNGSDSFTFKANDGLVDSNIGTVNITVTLVPDIPAANNQNVTTPEDVAKAITLTATNPDAGVLSYILISSPSHGTLSGTEPNLVYTPVENYSGPDSFTFKVNDGISESNVATVSITVTPVNDAPKISILPELTIWEDSVLQVCLNVVDVENDAITFEAASNIKGGGSLVLEAAPFDFCYVFTPPPNINGESIWNLLVTDAGGLTGSGSVKIIITPVNDPPVAFNDTISVPGRISTRYDVITNDFTITPPYQEFYDIYAEADSADVLSLRSIVLGPRNGTAHIENGIIKYKPYYEFMGPDSLQYRVCDLGHLCDTATLIIQVGPAAFKIYDGFSPNGDGNNDYWRIDGVEVEPYNHNHVQIFDRFNNLVFETRNYTNEDNAWKGQANHGLVKGSLPEGTYFYHFTIKNGESFSGFVVLKRQ